MQVQFGRAIKVIQKYEKGTKDSAKNNFSAREAIELLNEKRECSMFDKETSEKIRGFLRAQFVDYNRETGVIFKQYKGATYAITGEEAKKAKNAEKMYKFDMLKIEKRFPEKNRSKNKKEYYEKCSKAAEKRDNVLASFAENGHKRRADSTLTFEVSKQGNLKSIAYYSNTKTPFHQQVEYETLEL